MTVAPFARPLEHELETHRRELTGFCYRMLGSGSEAEDAVQETMLRAWRFMHGLEAPPALRSWLHRIATNVCLDMLKTPQRRARPMDMGPASTADGILGAGLAESSWVLPIPDGRVLPEGGDPADTAAARETLRLAFVAALQHLPPRQRAVLVLRDVLRWSAAEVAELLDTSVASVNSALQRARATLDKLDLEAGDATSTLDAEGEALVDRYVAAFEAYDIEGLTALLHEDALFCMPPWALWLRGPEQVGRWMVGQGAACRDSRVQRLGVNGRPGYAQWKPDPGGGLTAWSITVFETAAGRITEITNFIGHEHFELFGLPTHLEA